MYSEQGYSEKSQKKSEKKSTRHGNSPGCTSHVYITCVCIKKDFFFYCDVMRKKKRYFLTD